MRHPCEWQVLRRQIRRFQRLSAYRHLFTKPSELACIHSQLADTKLVHI